MRASEPAGKIPNDVRDHRAVGEQRIYTGSAAVEPRKGPRSIVCVCLRPVNKYYGDVTTAVARFDLLAITLDVHG